jgi:hypothetical protein
MLDQPAILLIPGAFGLPELYDAVVNAVAEHPRFRED